MVFAPPASAFGVLSFAGSVFVAESDEASELEAVESELVGLEPPLRESVR